MDKKTLGARKRALEKASGGPVHLISGASGEGILPVLRALMAEIQAKKLADQPVVETKWHP